MKIMNRNFQFKTHWIMLSSFVLTFISLSWDGRGVSQISFHADFHRFNPFIAPDSSYRPTIPEMQSIVRSKARPDQILVVVAGNSILLGVGQPIGTIWSERLQQLLGEKYAVVNLAYRGCSVASGGTIVAETLRDEYPKQIVIANLGATESTDIIGPLVYRFIVLDAYYKRLLLPWSPRQDKISSLSVMDEDVLNAKLDSVFYNNTFWNWISFKYLFTFPTSMFPSLNLAFTPRGARPDPEPDYEAIPFKDRFSETVEKVNLTIAGSRSVEFYPRQVNGEWELDQNKYNEFLLAAKNVIPDQLKRRTLLIVGRDAPYYRHKLPAEIQARDDLAFVKAVDGLESLGYTSLDYGREYAPEQYGDRTHLTKSGGARLADAIAPRIRQMAIEQGLLNP